MDEPICGVFSVSPQQRAIVDHVREHQVTVVEAGAGAGKTYVTIATVCDLLDRGLASLDQFVLITFTNKAADELRADLEKALVECRKEAPDEAAHTRWKEHQERLASAFIGTIHGFCRQILRGFGYGARVAREADVTFAGRLQEEALIDAAEAVLTDPRSPLHAAALTVEEYDLRKLAEQILDQMRGRGLSPPAVLAQTQAQAEDPGKGYRVAMAGLVADAAARYEARKTEAQRLDADDLLARTADLLTGPQGAAVAELLKTRYRNVFVDEFQDTDQVQKRVLDALLPALDRLLVVGDPKQSIYGFRAADVSLLKTLALEQQVATLPLSVSRRPTQALLNVQNALFEATRDRYPALDQPLVAPAEILRGLGSLPPFTYVHAGVRAEQADRIAATAVQIRAAWDAQIEDPDTPGGLRRARSADIVLLFRSNTPMRAYADALPMLLPSHIRVQEDAGGRLLQKPEIVSTYHMLRLLLHYPDDAVLAQAFRTPYFREIAAEAAVRQRDFLQYGALVGSPLSDWLENDHANYSERLKRLRTAVRTDTVPQLLARLYDAFGIREHFRTQGDLQAAENLERLRELARRLMGNEQALTLRQFAGWMQRSLLSGREEAEAPLAADDGPPPYVRLMTIHRAKGLEFPIVILPEVQAPVASPNMAPEFMIDPTEGLDIGLPVGGLDTRSPRFLSLLQTGRQDRIEEEMRVFYVALTRAQQAAILVGSGRPNPNPPESDYYSWRDEVLRARPELVRAGARFLP